MADPNRKINLNLTSDEEDDSDEPELELDPMEISLVKEFEEEFKDRFSEQDEIFTEFCKQKPKPPPIVFPFEPFQHNRGGHRGGNRGGRYQHGGHHHRGQNFDNRRNNYDGQRYNNYNRSNRGDRDHQQPAYKRPRDDQTPQS
jgi:hypothetical protein